MVDVPSSKHMNNVYDFRWTESMNQNGTKQVGKIVLVLCVLLPYKKMNEFK